MTNFPISLDSFARPVSNTARNGSVKETSSFGDLMSAVEALEAKVGANSSFVTTSLDYRVAALEALLAPLHFGTGAPSPSLGVNGDFYFNETGGAGTAIYQKRSGTWVGIV